MQVNIDGLVVMEKQILETDKLIAILTEDYGVIKAFVRGSRNIKSKNFSAVQLFCYSDFNIYKGRNKCIINEADLKKTFWKLRCDIEKLALAQYFCDLILNLTIDGQNAKDVLKLMLNSLYYLSENKISDILLKSIFEIRLLTLSGYMPHLVSCIECGNISDLYFVPISNGLLCGDCSKKRNLKGFKLSTAVLLALRYTTFSELKKVFSFELKGETQNQFSKITESYLLRCLEKNLNTLDFYKQISSN